MERHDSFGEWLRQRRRAFDLTQAELAERVGCSVSGLRKIESDERRPSRQTAELLAQCLQIAPDERPTFLQVARGVLRVERLGTPLPASAAVRSRPAPPRPASNLPTPPTPLIGREPELAALARLLRDPQCRLLTIFGPGGIGKTRLAIEAASAQRELFSDGVYFVPLVSLTSPQFIVPAMADALGFMLSGPVEPYLQLLNYLREKCLLLVLDNLDHLLEAGELLAELLQQAPGVKLLVTSRERLNLQAEWLFDLQGLPVPPLDQVDWAEEYSAVALFVQGARRVQAGFMLKAEERLAVSRICHLVEGMPLAIKLAAAWVRLLSCQEIAQEIENNLDFLSASARDMPERHRSIRAVFDQSWHMLSAEEQQVLRKLSVFRGDFQREAAEQVAGVSLPLLTALVDKSLLRRDEAGRYGLHELIRQYAASCLRDNPEEDSATRGRHSHYYLTMVQEREAALHSHRQKEVVAELTTEIDNLRLAWEWAAAQRQVTLLCQTAWPLWLYYSMRNLLQEGEAMLLRAVESVQGLNGTNAVDDAARQVALSYLQVFPAYFAFRQGRIAEAQQPLRQSLELLRRHDDQVALTNALWMYGAACMFAGQFQEASQCLREAYTTASASNRQWETTTCAVLIGTVEYELGDYAASHRWLSEGLALSQVMGDPRIISFAISAFGPTAHALGKLAEMESTLREATQMAIEAGDRFLAGLLQEQLAQVVHATGDVSQAKQLCQECITLYRGLGDPWSLSRTLTLLGNLHWAERDEAQALRCFLEALEIAFRASSYANALDALAGIATVKANNGLDALEMEMVLHIQQNPAATHQAKACAAQLQAALQARLAPQQIEAAYAKAQAIPFEAIVKEILEAAPAYPEVQHDGP